MDEENQSLNDEEYDQLYEGMLRAGIEDPEVMDKIVQQYELAAVQMTILSLLMDGTLEIKGVNANNELLVGKPEEVTMQAGEEIPKSFELKPTKRFDLN